MVKHSEIKLRTNTRTHWLDITMQVRKIIGSSGIKNGICLVTSLHTTAGLTINENADPDVQKDFFKKINSVFPQDLSFAHSEGNSDSHIKTSLVGLSVQLPIINGDIQLGIWQSIYFCEFDGPRERTASVTILGDCQ
jgi:secondary thiamine-phosphate synthase enzyme